MRERALRIAKFLALMIAVLAFFTFPLWSSKNLLYQGDVLCSDVTELNYPSRFFLARNIKQRSLPLWNPYIGCGFPTMMEGQAGTVYPLNLILFYTLPSVAAFNASVVLSLLLCLLFTYLLCRQYGISPPSALLSAGAFTFSGFMVAKLKFTYMVNSLCWMPLAVYGIEKSFASGKLLYFLLTSLALSMQLLAGGPQIFFITGTLVLFVFIWRLIQLVVAGGVKDSAAFFQRIRKLLPKSLAAFLICILIASALAAPQLIPQLKGFPYSDRSHTNDFIFSFGSPMRPENLVQFFTPYPHGNPARGQTSLETDFYWENITYPGLLCTVLALAAVIFLGRRRKGTVALWLAAALFALAVSLGSYLPLSRFLWKYVPGFKMFRFWQRYLAVTVLAVSILAGMGLDLILNRPKGGKAWRTLLVLLVFAVLLTDLGIFAHTQVTTVDAERMLEGNRTAAVLKDLLSGEESNYRIAVLGQRELWKAVMKQSGGWLGDKELLYQYMELLPPNHNVLFDLPSFGQYGDYGLEGFKVLDMLVHWVFIRREGWRARVPGSVVNLMALSSVKYLVTPFELDVDERYSEIKSIPTEIRGVSIRIYELKDAKPRAFLASDYRVIPVVGTPSHLQLLETLTDTEKALKKVILDEEPSLSQRPGTQGEARILHSDASRVVIEANAPEGGILVLNDNYYPEWKAKVNGLERPTLKANYAFRGVELTPGKSVVEFSLGSGPSFQGFLISAAAILLVSLILVESRRSKAFDLFK